MAIHNLLIAVADLQALLADPRLVVIDCRFELLRPAAGYEAYLQSHIPQSLYANLEKDLSGPVLPDTGRHPLPSVEDFAKFLGRCGIDGSKQVVVYDAGSGAIAARAWWMLRWLGHDAAAILDGGFAAWSAAGGALESGRQADPGPAAFRAEARHGRVLHTHDIELAQDGASLCLVDAREAARFRGEEEPIDRLAGHVPGATNLPYSRSLTDEGTWRHPDSLRKMWADIPAMSPETPWSVMCGSGVTACHLAVSGLLAGLQEPRLYVGSWSEWIRDPARPVATGPG